MNKYALEERTENFSKELLVFCKGAPNNRVVNPIINQLVRSGTSVGANYCEANSAASKKDFANKIHICKKEAQETCYWLRLSFKADDALRDEAQRLEKEAYQFVLIFGKILSTMRSKKD